MEDPNEFEIDKDIQTPPEVEKLGKYAPFALSTVQNTEACGEMKIMKTLCASLV